LKNDRTRARRAALLSLAAVVPAGFLCKYAPISGADWVANSLAGAFYVIFWCLVVFVLLPEAAPRRIAAGVLAATCALEALQRWHPPFLQAVRATFLGRTLIGSDFAWADFPFYVIGAVAGWAWLRGLRPRPRA